MKLYFAETVHPRKACAVAQYLGLPVTFIPVNLGKGENRTPEFLALNPNGKVPVLIDGDTTLWESNAIMCHLARKAGSDLWPQDARQPEVMRWLMWDATEFMPHAGALYFEHIIKPHFGMGGPDKVAVDKALKGFARAAAVLEAHLKGRRYLVADTLSLADFAVAVTLPYDTGYLPLQDFPEIRRWHDNLSALKAWQEPFPSNKETAPA
jgi:glutathione S-transferase